MVSLNKLTNNCSKDKYTSDITYNHVSTPEKLMSFGLIE